MKLLIAIFGCFAISAVALGQSTPKSHQDSFSFAISGGNYLVDQGLTASFTSPYYFDDKVAFRLSGSLHWMESYFAVTNDWVTYPVYQAGLTYKFFNQNQIALYSDAGALILFPDPKFSDASYNKGFYGSLGIEVYIFDKSYMGITYFIEPGFMVNDGRAEKLEQTPKFSNGFVTASGFRFHFYKKVSSRSSGISSKNNHL